MGEVSTIGLDIAKSVFQAHGVDVDGAVVMRKRIRRAKLLEFFAALSPCFVGIEAWAHLKLAGLALCSCSPGCSSCASPAGSSSRPQSYRGSKELIPAPRRLHQETVGGRGVTDKSPRSDGDGIRVRVKSSYG